MENLPNNLIDKIEKMRDEAEKVASENREETTERFSRIFDTEDGRFFYNMLAKYVALYGADHTFNNDVLREYNGKRKVVTELILPNLTKEVRRRLYD